ncbi:VIT1/CCC1 transporter family protein [Cellulomonas marina]|uniref:Predicted Fe2+/Mn2+ transporter, VIT1/CCC1 family n=1 Tax=Cellulomonas marina TaxID=988821 RepID=A0A1I0YMD2_9CELL|nr:VIT1/CCC1 transporter family protein [Cellulomonas marina]SFB14362.1 Predicted Fe2+/Mn2+ transporter, VIT1/CCC1 family [Cellulomonas marina]
MALLAPARTPVRTAADLNRLRAAVLGANDGVVSVAAAVLGVAGAAPAAHVLVVAGVAVLVGGALSMAAGEYVSVSSQRDAERAAAAAGATRADRTLDDEEHVNPWQAALASCAAFTVGGLVPLLAVLVAPAGALRLPVTVVAVVAALVLTGVLSARFGGAPVVRAVLRNVLGGGVAMAVTYGVGTLVGSAL